MSPAASSTALANHARLARVERLAGGAFGCPPDEVAAARPLRAGLAALLGSTGAALAALIVLAR